MIHISKYEFVDREQGLKKIEALSFSKDENGDKIEVFHSHFIVELHQEYIKEPIVNDDYELIEEGILDVFRVDVLWDGLIPNEKGVYSHPYGWKKYSLDLDDEGSHQFGEYKYLEHRIK
jgi:hypothetical protein